MYFGRYKKPNGWSQWLAFSGRDSAVIHCGTMAQGRDIELLPEREYQSRHGKVSVPKKTNSTGAYQRLIAKQEEPKEESSPEKHMELIYPLVSDNQEQEPQQEKRKTDQRESPKVGRPRIERPSKAILEDLYISQGLSIRAIAAELGLSRDLIHSALREYGIKTRPTHRPSSLSQFPIERIRERVRMLGYKKAAQEYGVSLGALYHYINTR